MTIFNDAARTIEIVIRTWDEANGRWSPDWSDDFYQAAAKDVPDGFADKAEMAGGTVRMSGKVSFIFPTGNRLVKFLCDYGVGSA